jgi:hypothetical protein
MKVVRSSASRTGRLYPQECSWYSFSLGAESTPEPWCGRKELSLKNPVTPPGIDPGTIQLVAQCLNHYTTNISILKKHNLRTSTLFRSLTTVCRCCHCPCSTRHVSSPSAHASVAHMNSSVCLQPLYAVCAYYMHVLCQHRYPKCGIRIAQLATTLPEQRALQTYEMSGDTNPMTRHHFPGDFKFSVKNFAAQVCVAAGTSVCTFHPLPCMTACCKVYIWGGI